MNVSLFIMIILMEMEAASVSTFKIVAIQRANFEHDVCDTPGIYEGLLMTSAGVAVVVVIRRGELGWGIGLGDEI